MSGWIPVSVAIGGAIGSLCRFAAGRWAMHWTSQGFPWATLAVNLLGSLAIGFWAAVLLKWSAAQGPSEDAIPIWDHAIRVGFLGGFTTFSAFSLETLGLLQDSRFALAAASILGNLVIGLLAAWFGLKVGVFVTSG